MSCPPAMRYHEVSRSGKVQKYLLRGDSDGAVVVWSIPEVTNSQLAQIKQEEFDKPPGSCSLVWPLLPQSVLRICQIFNLRKCTTNMMPLS